MDRSLASKGSEGDGKEKMWTAVGTFPNGGVSIRIWISVRTFTESNEQETTGFVPFELNGSTF
jgi:hypothetical protein